MFYKFSKWKLFCCLYNETEEPSGWLLINTDGPWLKSKLSGTAPLQFFFDTWKEAWDYIWKN